MFGLGPPELIIILLIVIIIFGAGRLSDVGGALGKSIREFRKAAKDDTDTKPTTTEHPKTEPQGPERPEMRH